MTEHQIRLLLKGEIVGYARLWFDPAVSPGIIMTFYDKPPVGYLADAVAPIPCDNYELGIESYGRWFFDGDKVVSPDEMVNGGTIDFTTTWIAELSHATVVGNIHEETP